MNTVQEIFRSSAAMVEDEFSTADASEKLRATLGLVDLTLRQRAEEMNLTRWEEARQLQMTPPR